MTRDATVFSVVEFLALTKATSAEDLHSLVVPNKKRSVLTCFVFNLRHI